MQKLILKINLFITSIFFVSNFEINSKAKFNYDVKVLSSNFNILMKNVDDESKSDILSSLKIIKENFKLIDDYFKFSLESATDNYIYKNVLLQKFSYQFHENNFLIAIEKINLNIWIVFDICLLNNIDFNFYNFLVDYQLNSSKFSLLKAFLNEKICGRISKKYVLNQYELIQKHMDLLQNMIKTLEK